MSRKVTANIPIVLRSSAAACSIAVILFEAIRVPQPASAKAMTVEATTQVSSSTERVFSWEKMSKDEATAAFERLKTRVGRLRKLSRYYQGSCELFTLYQGDSQPSVDTVNMRLCDQSYEVIYSPSKREGEVVSDRGFRAFYSSQGFAFYKNGSKFANWLDGSDGDLVWFEDRKRAYLAMSGIPLDFVGDLFSNPIAGDERWIDEYVVDAYTREVPVAWYRSSDNQFIRVDVFVGAPNEVSPLSTIVFSDNVIPVVASWTVRWPTGELFAKRTLLFQEADNRESASDAELTRMFQRTLNTIRATIVIIADRGREDTPSSTTVVAVKDVEFIDPSDCKTSFGLMQFASGLPTGVQIAGQRRNGERFLVAFGEGGQVVQREVKGPSYDDVKSLSNRFSSNSATGRRYIIGGVMAAFGISMLVAIVVHRFFHKSLEKKD
jgi:hypothetical protein